MALTSRTHGVTGRIRTATSNLHEDNQSLISDIGKAFSLMKEIAVDFGRAKQFERVDTYEDCSHFSSAIESVGVIYQPGPELTDFDKLFKNEVAQLKANSSSAPQNHPLMRQFREGVWLDNAKSKRNELKVHHAGEPMPGEEQEDIIMTSNQSSILNVTCPLSGKPVIELEHPVRSIICKHVYDKGAITQYLRGNITRCPVAACPAKLQLDKVKHDPLLAAEIDDLRKMQNQGVMTDVMDVTEFEEGLDDFGMRKVSKTTFQLGYFDMLLGCREAALCIP